MRLSASAGLLALPLAVAFPAKADVPHPAPVVAQYDEVGFATWYGEELAGARTASGARFRPSAITAAHRTLPLGSYVEVTALDSGRTILVLVNDRGPSQRNRLIDLSRGAATLLGMGNGSKLAVRVRSVAVGAEDREALSRGRPASTRSEALPPELATLRGRLQGRGTSALQAIAAVQATPQPRSSFAVSAVRPNSRYVVQVAVFSRKSRANALAERLDGSVASYAGKYRVRLGPYDNAAVAQRARDDAARRGYGDASIIVQP
ncbi:MAG: septal ring lytic transglycosylase RlpA family protein [Candidatus Sphingomonas colombiensis]|nr:septal ring lytic transglycosylase RlpA family protein [Sphingomonas sp.]WEK42773.1 MAG: septal ring lytic transglycosylase RlpA family protein [Sphingomonas sp.]